MYISHKKLEKRSLSVEEKRWLFKKNTGLTSSGHITPDRENKKGNQELG